MATIAEAFALASQYHRAGQLAQAEQVCRLILQNDATHADTLHLLGLLAYQNGKHEQAADYFRSAIAGNPGNAGFHSNLGLVLQSLGKLPEAIGSYQSALALDPTLPETHFNLANAHRQQGNLTEAAAHYMEALRLRPHYAEAFYNYGGVLAHQNKLTEAATAYEQVLRLRPDFAEGYYNLGNILRRQGKPDGAVVCYEKALQLKPNLAEPHSNLANVLRDQGKLQEALSHYLQARCLKPDAAEIHNNLGNTYALQGKQELALASYREALRVQPNYVPAHSNYLLGLNYSAGIDRSTLVAEHVRFAKQHVGDFVGQVSNLPSEALAAWKPAPRDRRLRIGYVSPDFRDHPVAYFLLPVLAAIDREAFEIYCYANVSRPDATTQQFQSLAQHWRNILNLTDQQAAELIRQDRIDILVDLAGHTALNRILLFANRLAPVQVTHFGYPSTTGLPTMDYRITDVHADPPGTTEQFYTEKLVRLPDVAWCYHPSASPDVNALPAFQAGHVTFGSFNNLVKLTSAMIALWCRILGAVPASRLLLLSDADAQSNAELRGTFQSHGVSGERIEFMTRRPRWNYLEMYHRVDIGLDPFPYNGGVTTCDSLWMGVPIITLAGDAYVSRQEASLLSTVGLHNWIAQTPGEYAELAIRHANDLPALGELRVSLRDRMKNSAITDSVRYARNLEEAYRMMFDCKKKSDQDA